MTEQHYRDPVPTADENVYTQSIHAFVDSERPAPSLPTREQIADRLIERLRNSGGWPVDEVWQRWQNLFAEYDRDIALFSQSTPTDEPTCTCGSGRSAHSDANLMCARTQHRIAAPPSIADMVPGTTFRARFRTSDRWALFVKVGGKTQWPIIDIAAGSLATYAADAVDPSKIRHVQVPKEPS